MWLIVYSNDHAPLTVRLPATVLFTCVKSWFFRNHLASFHQISHWSFCWNVIDSLFRWSCSIDCQAHIFFFKTKNCSNDISLVAMIGLEKYYITSACLQWLCHSGEQTVARGPLVYISAQNIDCGYSLEPPCQVVLTSTRNLSFWAEIRKIMYTPVNPSFTI